MAETIFVAASEPGCGKTVLSIGLVASLNKMTSKVGYMKIIGHRFEKDSTIDVDVLLIKDILETDDESSDMCPTTFHEMRNDILNGKKEETIAKIAAAYKTIAKDKEVVVVEGTDHTEMSSNLELNINADVAKAIDCKVLLVSKAQGRDEETILSDIETARVSYVEKGCRILGAVINNVPKNRYEKINKGLRDRLKICKIPLLGVLPSSDILPHPRISYITKHLDIKTEVLYGKDFLQNIAYSYIVGAMQAHNAINHFREGCLVITAGDRNDIILSVIATHMADGFPDIAGIILTGGLRPAESITKIIDNIEGFNIPVLSVPLDTYSTVSEIKNLNVHIEPHDKQKIDEVLFLVENHVDVAEVFKLSHVTIQRKRTPEDFLDYLEFQSSQLNKHIVFPEGAEERLIKAADIIVKKKTARITLLGNENEIKRKAKNLGVNLRNIEMIDPVSNGKNKEKYAQLLFERRKHKGMSMTMAEDQIQDPMYYGTLMVEAGDADGLVAGAVHPTANTIRPALQIIKTKKDVSIVSSVFFMLKGAKIFLYGDCAIIENPSAEQLCDIALESAHTAKAFNIEPYIALLSFSTGDSGSGPMVEKVRKASELALLKKPELFLEGPIQYDAAYDPEVAKIKYPDSKVAGKANVYIFPDLNSGNIAYKAVQRESGAIAVGPILQGLKKPVNDLSRGCSVKDIIYVTAITAIQASLNE